MMNKLSNKELVAAGHKFAANLDADTPLIDRAKMVSELATRLDVALAAATEAGKQRDALAAENAALNEMYRQAVKELDDTCFEMGMMRGEKSMEYAVPETPATTSALNAIRAEGIIMFASKQLAAAGDLESTITLERLMLDAEKLAGQLRAGKDGE